MVANTITGTSETFLRGKLAALARSGFDVSVVELAPDRKADLPGVTRVSARSKVTPKVLAEARKRYGNNKRAAQAGLVASAILSTEPDIVNFSFSGIAVSQRDVLPLLGKAKLTVSCRGAAEQIVPLVDPDRARLLGEVFARMDLIHCVSDDMRRTVEAMGAPPERIFVNRPAIDAGRAQGGCRRQRVVRLSCATGRGSRRSGIRRCAG